MNFRTGLAFLLVVGCVSWVQGAPPTVGFTAIAVRDVNGSNTERQAFETDGSPSRAIDNNFSTGTYLTTSGTTNVGQRVFLDLGASTPIIGFRWDKTDGYVDPHNLSFLVSTDSTSVPLLSRSFSPVTNLQNGYLGTELVNGSFSGNSITGESDGGGFYSVVFREFLNASAIRLDFKSTGPNDHYHVNELQGIVPEPSGLGIVAAGIALLARRRRVA